MRSWVRTGAHPYLLYPSRVVPRRPRNWCRRRCNTCEFSSCFFPKFKKSAKRGFSREMTYFFGFYGPKIGGGVRLPGFCPKTSKTLKFGLFWHIFACSGLVLQNSAAHQCTCL